MFFTEESGIDSFLAKIEVLITNYGGDFGGFNETYASVMNMEYSLILYLIEKLEKRMKIYQENMEKYNKGGSSESTETKVLSPWGR